MWPSIKHGQPGTSSDTITDEHWRDALSSLRYCQCLDAPTHDRLRAITAEFLRRKTFEAAAGLRLTDSMCVRIALQACVLILNLDLDYYEGWQAVIVYPGDFRVTKEEMDEAGVVHQWRADLSGEAWEHGPVILSWEAAHQGSHIVLHEFAHKIDMRNGRADGFPPLPAGMLATTWERDFKEGYARFCHSLDHDQPVRIDDYAAQSPAEFFAVLSEVFFVEPAILHADFPALYEQLRAFYRQDPLQIVKTYDSAAR